MTISLKQPKIYVACLASYVAGNLHGEWIDADQDAEDIQAEIDDMLEASPTPDAEEFAIHDFEDFEGIEIGEYESIENVAELARNIAEFGEAFAIYAAHVGALDDVAGFQDAYCGCHKSEEDFAYDDFNSTYEVPEHLEFYIDYKAVTRDWFMGDFWSEEGSEGTHVFRRM